MWIHCIRYFSSSPSSCRKVGKSKGELSQRAACSLHKPVSLVRRPSKWFKELKGILHFFLLCKDQWCHLHPCSGWPGDWLPVVRPLFPPELSLVPRLPPNQHEMLHAAKPWRRRICDFNMDSTWYPTLGSRLKTQQLHLLRHYCCSALPAASCSRVSRKKMHHGI